MENDTPRNIPDEVVDGTVDPTDEVDSSADAFDDERTPIRTDLPVPVTETLKALASLKITVVLFALGIFVVLAGTFAQTKVGNWKAVDDYFRCFLTFIEFDVFFPRSFFPDRGEDPVVIQIFEWTWSGFYFPGGWAIGTAMLVNLLAAHTLRFKAQAKGARLGAGLGVIAVGIGLTWLVVASGDNDKGLQVQMSKYLLDGLWYSFFAVLAAGAAGAVYGMVQLDRDERAVEWWASTVTAVLLAGVLGYLVVNNEAARLKPESMRILWQLVKASTASAALLVGCILVFKKRGGVVLLHAGIGLLMLSELFVGLYAVEGRMRIKEGETTNYAFDTREVELAFVDESDEENEVHVVIPESQLKRQRPIRLEGFPIVVKPAVEKGRVLFLDNSAPRAMKPDELADLADVEFDGEPVEFKEAAGSYTADELEPTNGFDETVDMASVWVDLETTDGKPLGRWLFGQELRDQKVVVDDKTYTVGLRFKRTYFPYSVHLIDIRKKDYVGTATPKDYSSFIRLYDSETDFVRENTRIYMNNPLRYRGQTLYQSDYRKLPETNPNTGRPLFDENGEMKFAEYTTLQVVTNKGWMLPYVCCMIVMFGMTYQFYVALDRFLVRRSREQGRVVPDTAASSEWSDYIPTAAALVIAVLFLAFMARPASTGPDELAIHEFGKAPVTSKGRVKPFDSLARNQLLIITQRERFRVFAADGEKGKAYNDVAISKKSRPAIEWLLDTATHPKRSDDYPIFRITEPNLIEDLDLNTRPGFFRYSYNEIKKKFPVIRDRVDKAGTDELEWTFDERKAIELNNNVQTYLALQVAFRDAGSAANADLTETEYIRMLLRVGDGLKKLPLAVPRVVEEGDQGENDGTAWESYAAGAARMWCREFARKHDLRNLRQLALKIAEESRDDRDYEEAYEIVLEESARLEVASQFALVIMRQQPGIGFDDARRRALEGIRNPPDNIRPQVETLLETARERVSEETGELNARTVELIAGEVERSMPEVLGDFDLDAEDPPEVVALHGVLAAYREGKVEEFDTAVAKYVELVDSKPRTEYDPRKVRFEAWFNGFSPLWVGQWLSLLAFLLAIASWMVAPRATARAAFWTMVLTFVLATFALCARMYISGRPPVTNLYSSAVFIAWGGMLLGLLLETVYRTGIGTAVAAMLGFVSLGIAQFLAMDGDTIAVMQAVLDTNIWLATHVVCVTMGYAATFVAGFFGLWYVGMGLCTTALDAERERSLVKMIYGTLCFAILFSFVGTVLGGLWADDSWGRFWGWDPKENGALIIVLWNALVLHARWDGMVRNRGLAVLAVAGNITTAWSWFGTNELRAGLHSYGFTEGVLATLGWTMLGMLVVIAFATAIPRHVWPSFANRK